MALAAALGVAFAGCGGPEAMTLDWNFSKSHLVADAPGFDTDLDSQDLRPIEALSLTFPDGSVFRADGEDVRRVNPSRSGQVVTDVVVVSQPQSADSAYTLASKWARTLGVPRASIDRWRADGSTGTHVLTTDNQHRLGDGGPIPSLNIGSSFEDDKPFLVTVTFYWPRAAA